MTVFDRQDTCTLPLLLDTQHSCSKTQQPCYSQSEVNVSPDKKCDNNNVKKKPLHIYT